MTSLPGQCFWCTRPAVVITAVVNSESRLCYEHLRQLIEEELEPDPWSWA